MSDVRDVRGRYIDADKFITTIDSSDKLDAYSAITVCDLIENEPTADVRENVHSEWVKYDEGDCTCWHCGFVLEDWTQAIFYNYCPNCGADMREGEEQ